MGWNIQYEFKKSDLETSNKQIVNLLNNTEDEEVPWDALFFLTGEINYGGRVTDNMDRICIKSILKTYLNPETVKEGYAYSKSKIYYPPADGDI